MLLNIKKNRSENIKYDYHDFPIYIRRAFISAFPNYSAECHWHNEIELIYIVSGELQYNVNGKVETIRAGEGIIVNEKQLHFGYSDKKQDCEFICVLFNPSLLHSISIEEDYTTPILKSSIPYFLLSRKVEWQKDILRDIQDIYDKKKESFSKLYFQGKLCLLWCGLLHHALRLNNLPKLDRNIFILKNMIDFIHENYDEKITLDQIANAGQISKRTCDSIFLKYQGKTPIKFLMEYRLRKSTEYLKNDSISILEIALAVGFSGSSYYAKTFRKIFGQTPSNYRKSNNMSGWAVDKKKY